MREYSNARGAIQSLPSKDLSLLLSDGPDNLTAALDLPLDLTIFRNVSAKSKRDRRLTLRQLHDLLSGTTARNKSELPLIKLGSFGDVPTTDGSLRSDANMLRVSGVEGDYDAGEISPENAADRLQRAGVAALVYTSPRHTADAPRWRVLAPLANTAAPSDRQALCARLNGALGGILARESFNLSQSYFFGTVTGGTVRSFLVDGQPLDRVAGLTSISPPPKPDKIDGAGSTSPLPVSDAFVEAVLDHIPNNTALADLPATDRLNQGYTGLFSQVAFALWRQYRDDRDRGKALFHDWASRNPDYDRKVVDARWRGLNDKSSGGHFTLWGLIQIAEPHGFKRDDYAYDWADDFEDDAPRSPTDLTDLLGGKSVKVELPEDARAAKIGVIRAKNGDLKPTLHNAILVLRTVNRDRGFNLRKNDMTGQDEWRGGQLQDADLGMIRVAVEQAGMHNVGADLTAGAVRAVAELNRFHPVRDWLARLQHDGTPRLDTWLTRYIGAPDNAYTRAVGRAFLVALVARVMAPGCKHDHVLVLGGEQGIGKSTACSILGGAWFGDNMPSIRDGAKEAGLYLRGHWLVELAELAPSRKAEAEDLKAFLTRATDEIRAPYARKADAVPRQCVFVGTTNETAFLRDVTGGRRFWPIACGTINTNALTHDRGQLFAEALTAFHAGERWHLTQEMDHLAQLEQEDAREEDSWEGAIADFLAGDGEFNDPVQAISARDLLTKLGVPLERQSQSQMQRVARILKRMGWDREHNRNGKVWVRK